MDHNGFYSYLAAAAAPADYYATAAANEVIAFADGAKPIAVNSLLIENCSAAAMYIVPNASGYVLCIPAGESRTLDALTVYQIKVLGAEGQKLRYSGMVV
jgi:hypothetical protein